MKLRLAIVFLFAAAGCSGGDDGGTDSGVDGSKPIGSLSASEQQDLCAYTVDVEGGPRTVACGDFDVEIAGVAECVENLAGVPATCPATVEESEACAAAIGDDPCHGFGSDACDPLLACAG